MTQKELVNSNVILQPIPLVFGTSKFKILMPVDQHLEISKPAPQEQPPEDFMYRIKSKLL